MSGNVAEFCSDIYEGTTEHVIRGGSFRDGAADVRSAARDHTRTDEWLKTDPQMPKSIWWYSDCFHVGFRVVLAYSPQLQTPASDEIQSGTQGVGTAAGIQQ